MQRVAIFLPSLEGGGAERAMLNLAIGMARRGIAVDLVLASATGGYLNEVPSTVRLVDLNASRLVWSLPALVSYLRTVRPESLIAALSHANVVAAAAHLIARSRATLLVSERVDLAQYQANTTSLREKILPALMRLFYRRADRIVAVSGGVADSVAAVLRVPREAVSVVYNPVVTAELIARSKEPVTHPWFVAGAPPVILAVGRLSAQKDFATLIGAFAALRRDRAARLLILGEGGERAALENLARELGVGADVQMPGFEQNPFRYMRAASVLVLSSRYEGLPNVLIQAMACGTPIVSTDCPSGPSEILDNGAWGQLVPAGDAPAMAYAMARALDDPSPPDVAARAALFGLDQCVDRYLALALRR